MRRHSIERRRIFFLLLVAALIAALTLPLDGGNAYRASNRATYNSTAPSPTAGNATSPVSNGSVHGSSTQGVRTSPVITPSIFQTSAVTGRGVIFTSASNATSTANYNVTFTESGLLSGTQWSVAMQGYNTSFIALNFSITSAMTFFLTNGSYYFFAPGVTGYNVSNPFGYIIVTGANVTQKIVYIPSSTPVYSVTLTEIGYPGDYWNLSLNGLNLTMPGRQIGLASYMLPNGTYHFTVGNYPGYTAYPASGTILVKGKNATQRVYYFANSVQVSTVTFTGSNMHVGFGLAVVIVSAFHFTNNLTLTYINYSASNKVTAYLPAGNYVPVVLEYNNPGFEYIPTAFASITGSQNISEVGYASYLNITSASAVTVNTTFPALFKTTYAESHLSGASLWSVAAGSSRLLTLIGSNESLVPSPTPYSAFDGEANLSLSQRSMTGYLPNGTYNYTASVSAYNQTGNFGISGANVTVNIYFPDAFYTVSFTELGLPSGHIWLITVNGTYQDYTFGNSMDFTLANGTYSFEVQPIYGYMISPAGGNVTVDGSNVSETIYFSPLITVEFSLNYLPAGMVWSVTLNGSTESSNYGVIEFYMPAGNYSFYVNTTSGYVLSPSNGTVSVSSAAVYVSITNLGQGYAAKFTESGLPSGTAWYVNLSSGKSLSSSSSSMTVELLNGSYSYTVGTANHDYSAKGSQFSVSGAPQSVSIAFTLVVYNVTFTETGLPGAASWSVTLDGATRDSTTANMTFSMSNGTYTFSVGNESGYSSAPSSGNLTVSGSAVGKVISYSKNANSSNMLSTTDYEIFGGVVIVAVIASAAGVMLARRRKRL